MAGSFCTAPDGTPLAHSAAGPTEAPSSCATEGVSQAGSNLASAVILNI